MLHFTDSLFLLLSIPAAVFILLWIRKIGFRLTAESVAVYSFALTIIAVILALAGPYVMMQHNAGSVVYLIDVSSSVSDETLDEVVHDIVHNTDISDNKHNIGFVAFGSSCIDIDYADLRGLVNGRGNRTGVFAESSIDLFDGTNIEQAISWGIYRLGGSGRLVLYSDCCENAGRTRLLEKVLSQGNVELEVKPVSSIRDEVVLQNAYWGQLPGSSW